MTILERKFGLTAMVLVPLIEKSKFSTFSDINRQDLVRQARAFVDEIIEQVTVNNSDAELERKLADATSKNEITKVDTTNGVRDFTRPAPLPVSGKGQAG